MQEKEGERARPTDLAFAQVALSLLLCKFQIQVQVEK